MSNESASTSTTTVQLQAADNIRILAASMVEKAKSGHPGGPMGGADFVHILFSEFMQFDPDDPTYPFRDRFFLDPGHMSAMLYAQLHLFGFYSMDDLKNFRQWGSPTPGHPEVDVKRGVENTSGPLGVGHTFGVGAAVAERFLAARFGEWTAHKTFLYISDGGVQEEISQGAGRTAGFLGLGNIVMFYDANDIQLSTTVPDVMSEDTGKKYEAWGWHVITIKGNDHDEIRQAIQAGIDETDRPTLIIGKTIMGKGAVTEEGDSYEGMVDSHGKPISKSGASFEKTVSHLGGNPDDPFQVFPEVQELYAASMERKRQHIANKRQQQADWEAANPAEAARLKRFLSGELPELDFAGIPQKPNSATRNASAAVLSYLADQVDNMVVASADLCNSDKTEAFLKKTSHFRKGDFSGQFYQAGVSEFTMAAVATGMALHGGVIPACATFFVFSDFMKPAIRLACLMEQPVIFIWTHDAFRVGEDGPTHQPVEQEAQIRLLEQLKNHSGKSSFLALRPADANETTVAWKMALDNRSTPSGLILSRQNVPNLVDSSYDKMLAAEKGGYVVEDDGEDIDVLLLANGSEVATLAGGAALLRERKGMKIRVVSVPSEGRFMEQSEAYRQSVLPKGVPVYGLTAGLPITLRNLVGDNGKIQGLDHFGYSAPYTVLDEKFGFTAERVYDEIVSWLGR